MLNVLQGTVCFESSWQEQSQELKRVDPDHNICSIKCGTNTYLMNSMRFEKSSTPNFKLWELDN